MDDYTRGRFDATLEIAGELKRQAQMRPAVDDDPIRTFAWNFGENLLRENDRTVSGDQGTTAKLSDVPQDKAEREKYTSSVPADPFGTVQVDESGKRKG